jgi:DNA-binding transcriptional MerR regulator
MKLKELCDRLGVDYDQARYTLARGVLSKAIASSEPGRGNHRVFHSDQAFYLAVCLKLKDAGVNTALAGQIADWSRKIHSVSQNLGWDHRFAPFAGRFDTEHQWYVDVGDARYARLVTDANPSRAGLDEMPWTDMKTGRSCPTARPMIIFRLDIGRIAEQLKASAKRLAD